MNDQTHTTISAEASTELSYIRKAAMRDGYIWEGARPAYEAGTYQAPVIAELLEVGALVPHPDPAKGWIVQPETIVPAQRDLGGEVIECARDLVSLWKNQKIEGLPRAERNAAIEGIREKLIAAVDALDGKECQQHD